jgi:hypothetical protein
MTEPLGAQETVRIIDKGGRIVATVQAQQFPPIEVSGVVKVGENLILRATRFENGKPVEALVILKLNGETMNMIQELEGSVITKRGSGKRQEAAIFLRVERLARRRAFPGSQADYGETREAGMWPSRTTAALESLSGQTRWTHGRGMQGRRA